MRLQKERLKQVSLSQYVQITRKEDKLLAAQSHHRITRQDSDDLDYHPGERVTVPGLILPAQQAQAAAGGVGDMKSKAAEQQNVLDDNYAFYMYYLNQSGQLVTPVEQKFQDNAVKQEKLRKLQEQKDKLSRVVKPKVAVVTQQQNGKGSSPPRNLKKNVSASPSANISMIRPSGRQSRNATPSKSVPAKARNINNRSLEESQENMLPPKSRQSISRPSMVTPQNQSGKVQQITRGPPHKVESSMGDDTNRKHPFLKRNKEQKQVIVPKPKQKRESKIDLSQQATPNRRSLEIYHISNQDELRVTTQSFQRHISESQIGLAAFKGKAGQKENIISKGNNQGVQKASKKLKVGAVQSDEHWRLSKTDLNKPPLILIKKSTTIAPERNEDEYRQQQSQQEESLPELNQSSIESSNSSTLKGTYFKNALQNKNAYGAKKPFSKSMERSSMEESPPTLHLPPLNAKPPQYSSQQKNIPKPPSGMTRPPLPQIKTSNSQGSSITMNSSHYSQSRNTPSGVYVQSQQSQQLTSSRQSARDELSQSMMSGKSNKRMSIQNERAMEYYNTIKKAHKPKVDPRKSLEIEMRQNSVSLNELEQLSRAKPVKKVQLSDLL